MRIIGIVNWFRPYMQNLSSLLSGINMKLSKNYKFDWNQKDQETLELLQQKIKERILLNYPDFNKYFVLEADASEHAIGAVLLQDNKIVGLYSYKYNSSEKNYTIVEKETLANKKAIKRIKTLIFNSKM